MAPRGVRLEGDLVVERKELELRAFLVLFVLQAHPLGDLLAVAIPNALAQIVEEFIDGQRLFGGLVIGDVGVWVRIPAQTGHRFRSKLDSHSGGNWTVIPVQTGH